MSGLGSQVTLWERNRAEVMLRRPMRPDESMLRFATRGYALDYLAAQTRHGRIEQRSPLHIGERGTYVVIGRVLERGAARGTRRPAQPRGINYGVLAAILAPIVIMLGLLLWQPVWTLGTIGAMLALVVYAKMRGSSMFVEVLTRVRIRR